MGHGGPYCLTDNGGVGRTPRRARPQPVPCQAEEGPQRQTDMTPLGTGGAVLGAFAIAVLRDTTMGRFDPPPVPGVLRTLVSTHRQVARGPVGAATVWGGHRDHRADAIARQMHDRVSGWHRYVPDRSMARSIGITEASGVQVGQPRPGQRAHQVQVLQAGMPALDGEQARLKPACRRCLHHRPDVVVLEQPVVCVGVDTDVTGEVSVPIRPQEADQRDAHDDALLVARPLRTAIRTTLTSTAPGSLKPDFCSSLARAAGEGRRWGF